LTKLDEILNNILDFRKERDWGQFHTAKNLAVSITIEAAELLECFQWSESAKDRAKIEAEIADVFIYLLLLCHDLDIEPLQAISKKMLSNRAKYPVEKAKGRSEKYDRL